MNCHNITNKREACLDGELEPTEVEAIEHHLQSCATSRQAYADERQLRAALRQLPVAGPTAGFFERALKEAAGRHQRHRHHWLGIGFGGGLAAGLALWVVTGLLSPQLPAPDQSLAGVSIALNEVHNVNLAINARHELSQAQLTITLPAGMELAGFPGRHQLSWHTDLKAGNNLLQLPVVAHSAEGGVLVARITHQDQSETLRINMKIRAEHQSFNRVLPMSRV